MIKFNVINISYLLRESYNNFKKYVVDTNLANCGQFSIITTITPDDLKQTTLYAYKHKLYVSSKFVLSVPGIEYIFEYIKLHRNICKVIIYLSPIELYESSKSLKSLIDNIDSIRNKYNLNKVRIIFDKALVSKGMVKLLKDALEKNSYKGIYSYRTIYDQIYNNMPYSRFSNERFDLDNLDSKDLKVYASFYPYSMDQLTITYHLLNNFRESTKYEKWTRNESKQNLL